MFWQSQGQGQWLPLAASFRKPELEVAALGRSDPVGFVALARQTHSPPRQTTLTGIRLAVKRQGRLASAIVLKQLPGNPVARRSTAIARRYTRNRAIYPCAG